MLWSVPAQNALLFAGYGAGLGWCSPDPKADKNSESPPLWHVFAGGCMGGLVQSFIMSPVELVKVRLQLAEAGAVGMGAASSREGALGSIALATGVVRVFGMRGLLSRGLGATMGRDVFPHGVWFATYEWCKRKLSEREGVSACDNGALSVGSQLGAGGAAATTAWLVGYPFDVIKTRVQGLRFEKGDRIPSVLATAGEMFRQDGVRVFYRGLGLKLARAVPMSMIGFFAYEEAARELRSLFAAPR